MLSSWAVLRRVFRVFRAYPGVTAVAAVSLGLGIGANSVMFSLVDGMFLRPFPVRDPGSLLWVGSQTTEGRESGMGWPDYLDLKASGGVFADIAVQNRRGGLLDRGGETELVLLTIVSDNYFTMLGVEAARGRLFRRDLDAALGGAPAIAISDSLWRRYGADPGLIGRTIRMNQRPFTVVGVLPPAFRGLLRAVRNDVWVPVSTWQAMGRGREFEGRGPNQWDPLARLRPGATVEQAQAQLDALTRRFQQDYPGAYRGRRLVGETEAMRFQQGGRKPTAFALALVGLVLLTACANVAMLLLGQAEARKRDIGIRLALGAGRARLVRQLLTESAFLAAGGGALALLIAWWAIPWLPALLPPGPDFVRYDVRLDSRVVAVTLLACMLTVLLAGLAPALAAARTDLSRVIKGGGREGRRRFAGRSALVAGQAALSVVLLTAAGLLTRSFLYTQGMRLGFDTDRAMLVLLAAIGRNDRAPAIADEITERIRALPGVRNAAYCRRLPLTGSGSGATRDVTIPGREGELLRLRYNQVSPDYFAVSGTRLRAGRLLERGDRGVVLVNETMARKHWPDGGAVGRWLRLGKTDVRIVGVVEDAVISRVHEPPESFLYLPFPDMPVGEVTFLVESGAEPGALLDGVKREMRRVSPEVAFLTTATLRAHLKGALYADWLAAVLAASLGVLGMLLAAAGLFALVLHAVNRRMRELGLRLALGAGAGGVLSLVVRHTLWLAGAGAAVGAALSLVAGRLLAGMLYGVSRHDPTALLLSVAIVLTVALAASLYPAWKATRVDPAAVLREE